MSSALDQILLIPGIGRRSSFAGLLDLYPGAAAAYSLRKLRAAYSGPCLRVRRSSDSAEQDIGFANNVLDTAGLLSFVGAGDGFVTTWYDQTGNNRNRTQTTSSLQPTIVSSGSVVTAGGLPVVQTPTANAGITLNGTVPITNGNTDVFDIFSLRQSSSTLGCMLSQDAQTAQHIGISASGSSVIVQNFGNTSGARFRENGSLLGADITRDELNTAWNTGSLTQVGSSGQFNSSNWTGSNELRFWGYNLGASLSGAEREFETIFYLSNQSANRAAIDANQKQFAGIT